MATAEQKLKDMLNNMMNEGRTREASQIHEALHEAPDRVRSMIIEMVDLMDKNKPVKTEVAHLWTALTILLGRMSRDIGVPVEKVQEAVTRAYEEEE